MPKKPTPTRQPKGQGGVEKLKTPDGIRFRARKRKKGFPPALGSVRESWREAYDDLPTLPAPDSPLVPQSSVPTFQDFIRSQLTGARQHNVEAGTLERDEIVWRTRVYGSELGKSPIDQIDEDMCDRFINAQTHAWRPVKVDVKDPRHPLHAVKNRGDEEPKVYVLERGAQLTQEGLKRIGAVVSTYLEIARKRPFKYIPANPMQDVEYPNRKKETRRKSLRPSEAAEMETQLDGFLKGLRSQGKRFHAMALVQRDTGQRSGELCALQRPQLIKTLGGYVLEVDAAIKRSGKRANTKTSNSRQIPIGNDTAQLLLEQPDRGPYFFTTKNRTAVNPGNYYRDFKKFAAAIGMPKLSPHKLRNTYISLLLLSGKDIKSVQKLVGHASERMIMRIYAETFDEGMADAPDRLKALLDANRKPAESAEKVG